MTRKGDRIVAKRIVHVLEQKNKVSMRFSEIFKTLAENGWLHSQRPISDNLKFLIAQKKVAHIGSHYALIQTRENGTKFAVIEDPVEKVIELGK